MRKIQVMVDGISMQVDDSLLTKKLNGDYEKHYNANMSLDTTKILEVTIMQQIADGEKIVKGIVNSVIDDYNMAYGLSFESVENCFTYSLDINYTHNQFCVDICAYKILTWETARARQLDGSVTLETTEEEFIAMLPIYEGIT